MEADTELPPFFDTFDDYREFCLDYRASLGKIARLTACLLPEPALAAASRRLSSSLGLCSVSGASLEVRNSHTSEFTHYPLGLRECKFSGFRVKRVLGFRFT